jgi:putative restriction endonuclease
MELRSACFLALDALRAQLGGDDLRYDGALRPGFSFGGVKVPFFNRQKGIYRAAAQSGPAALAIQTSANSPYADADTGAGWIYDYRAGDPNQPDNRALRTAHELQVPLVYYVATRPGRYTAEYPVYVTADDRAARCVLVQRGVMAPVRGTPEPQLPDDEIARVYAFREARVRVHQRRFRGRVLVAYRDQCAVCRLKEPRLLDAAHIVGDLEERGEPEISNGLSLCSIHHRAFDEDLVGITPDYDVRVSRRLLDDEDGPMLELLKGFDRQPIVVPRGHATRPDRERLAVRFERFLARTA